MMSKIRKRLIESVKYEESLRQCIAMDNRPKILEDKLYYGLM
jgi:hypothetical protein